MYAWAEQSLRALAVDMLVVGITGGIASGKTAASNRFAELGVPVVDADVIAHQIVEPGRPACKKVIEEFGPEIAIEDGGFDRAKLRKIVFADSKKKELLESILHPEIRKEILRQLSELSSPYAIVVIPLLAESKSGYPLDRVLVIDLPEDIQIQRVKARDAITTEEAERIIHLQASRTKRLAMADDTIVNTGSIQTLNESVEELHHKYLSLANNSNES